jgi:putative RNA 2'-phosphotransferase
MLNEKENTKISKFLSLVLRHQPDTIGIELDDNGWTNTQILLEKLNENGLKIDLGVLKYIVETNAKKRFAFNETFEKIRANQGHSVQVELGYRAQIPPTILYHGTGQNAVNSILQTGLDKRQRHHVHLSADIETATKVGQRHGKPFIFKVLAAAMHREGFTFFLSDNGVWLTDNVPVQYLKKD